MNGGFKPSHPGEVLRELYMNADGGFAAADVARRSGLGADVIDRLLACEIPVTPEIEAGLDRALSTKDALWSGIQKMWDEAAESPCAPATPAKISTGVFGCGHRTLPVAEVSMAA